MNSREIKFFWGDKLIARIYPLKKGGVTVDLSPYVNRCGMPGHRVDGMHKPAHVLAGIDRLLSKYNGHKIRANCSVAVAEQTLRKYIEGKI